MIRVGTAGWSLPGKWQDRFPEGPTHLHRYGGVLNAVEINTTFRKTPRASTFARWAERVPSRAAADAEETESAWCIFDNTAAGEGTGDALALREMLGESEE